jgi:hypothetical protein
MFVNKQLCYFLDESALEPIIRMLYNYSDSTRKRLLRSICAYCVDDNNRKKINRLRLFRVSIEKIFLLLKPFSCEIII